jgi:hypothetical protein
MRIPQTQQEIIDELRGETPLNRARRAFSSWSARIDQASKQRTPLDPIEWRRMEFVAVAAIAEALAERDPAHVTSNRLIGGQLGPDQEPETIGDKIARDIKFRQGVRE